MRVDGQLKKAQLELVNGSTFLPDSDEAIGARLVADVDDPADAKPYFHNGTEWKEIQLKAGSDGVISQNSGKACTVDWSTGLVQRVALTDNALISFSNPQEGQIHRLIIAQNETNVLSNTGTTYVYALNMPDQDCGAFPYQPEVSIPFAQERQIVWMYKAGARAAYATVPTTSWDGGLVGGILHSNCNFSPDGSMLVVTRTTSPYHDYLRISTKNNIASCSPLRASLNLPVTPIAAAGAVVSAKYHQTGEYIFTASGTSPYIEGYGLLDRGVPVTAKYSNPATLPAGAGLSLDIHPNGQYVGIGHQTTPFMSIYPFNGAGFGTKLTDPATLPPAQASAFGFNPVGGYLAMSTSSSPYLRTWAFADSAGTGTIGSAAANPSTLPTGGASATGYKQLAWRPQGDFIAITIGNLAPYLYVVPFSRSSGTYGTPITIANGLIGQEVRCINWSPDGQYLIVGTNTAGSASIYLFDFSTIADGTTTTLPAAVTWDGAMPTVAVNDIVVHPSGEYFVAMFNVSPWATIYRFPQKVRNYVRLQ